MNEVRKDTTFYTISSHATFSHSCHKETLLQVKNKKRSLSLGLLSKHLETIIITKIY